MRVAGVLLAVAALGHLAACEMPEAPAQWESIEVSATPVAFAPGRDDIAAAGPLTFMGGVELKSAAPRFGGLSGLSVGADGRFVAISDAGAWISGRLRVDEAGRLVGVEGMRLASMRDETGAAFASKRDGDAEDIARLPDGRYAVSFEQNHRILIYDLDGAGPTAPATPGPGLAGAEIMNDNEGLEALALLPDGRLIGVAEFAPTAGGSPFWLLDPAAKVSFAVAGRTEAPPGYGVVGLTALPNGDLLRLERFYLPFIGVRMQVRLIPASALAGETPNLRGTVIATLEPPVRLDNFESIASVAQPDGSVRLYLLSDDNFSSNNKTLLYAFDYRPTDAPPPAAPPPTQEEVAPALEDIAASEEAEAPAQVAEAAPAPAPRPQRPPENESAQERPAPPPRRAPAPPAFQPGPPPPEEAPRAPAGPDL